MKEIPLSQVLFAKSSRDEDTIHLIKSHLSGRPSTEVIEGELMVYLNKENRVNFK